MRSWVLHCKADVRVDQQLQQDWAVKWQHLGLTNVQVGDLRRAAWGSAWNAG
jgi:hypothetical protein